MKRGAGDDDERRLAARNKRLAMILGLLAAGIYTGYILVYYF
jgi:hypothetical protein